MDEAMDTSEIVVLSDDGLHSSNHGSRQSTSMQHFPSLYQQEIPDVQRTMLGSGWISTRPSSSALPRVVLEDNTSSSNPQTAVQTSSTFHANRHDAADAPPPPIEDTDLIMINRPVSPHLSTRQDAVEVQEMAPSPALGTVNQGVDIASDDIPTNHVDSPARDGNELESEVANDEAEIVVDSTTESGEENPVNPLPPPESDVENMPLSQRIRSPDPQPPVTSPPPKKAKIVEEIIKAEDSYDEEEGNLCPICFDAWTNSGTHRLVSLRCGHLFGHSCITHWLSIHKANEKKCPQCKKKVAVKDIRPLYASKIRVLDTSELESLKDTVKKLEEERDRLSRELAYERQLHQDAIKVQQEQELRLQQLQNKGIFTQSLHLPSPATSKHVAAIASQIKISLTNRIEVARDGGCRVLSFNEWKSILVASQPSISTGALFAGYGIRLIDTEGFNLRQYCPLHSKPIRDLSFNPHRKDLLLSASMDKTAKMFCMSTNASTMTFNAEVPLWSCCWDGNNSNIFFAGSSNGITFQYDIRNSHTEVCKITTPNDAAPVVALAAISAGNWLPNGGFLSCRLNRLRVYERSNNSEFKEHTLGIEGPFTSLNYDHNSRHMLVSTRPTTQYPHVQHNLYELGYAATQPRTNIVHSFVGGTTQRVMSRPCQLEIDGSVKDTLVCAHQESEGHVAIWSVISGQKIPAGPLHCSEDVMDLCPVKVNNATFLASLSEKTLRVYQFS